MRRYRRQRRSRHCSLSTVSTVRCNENRCGFSAASFSWLGCAEGKHSAQPAPRTIMAVRMNRKDVLPPVFGSLRNTRFITSQRFITFQRPTATICFKLDPHTVQHLAGQDVARGLVRIEQTNLDQTTARNEPQGAVARCLSARSTGVLFREKRVPTLCRRDAFVVSLGSRMMADSTCRGR